MAARALSPFEKAIATATASNPIEHAAKWQYITISGALRSPGVIPPGGINGFERETGWDIQKGKGSQGATLTIKTYPPAEGTIEFTLWKPEHWGQWAAFVLALGYDEARKGAATRAQARDIYHPSFVPIKLTQVVPHKISPIRHVGKGKYTVSVKFIEWQDPPPVNVSATVNSSKANDASKTPGAPPDPIGDANQASAAAKLSKLAFIRTGVRQLQ